LDFRAENGAKQLCPLRLPSIDVNEYSAIFANSDDLKEAGGCMKILVLMFLIASQLVFGAETPLQIKVERIDEKRVKLFLKDSFVYSSDSRGIELTLRIEGAALKQATSYGNIKIIEALDDAGTDLKVIDKGDGVAAKLDNEFKQFFPSPREENGVIRSTMGLNVGVPARKATKITRLKAEVQIMAGGDRKMVKITKLATMQGKEVEDPTLKAAGVTVKILPAEKNDGNSLNVEVKGNLKALAETDFKDPDVIDAKGEPASNGASSSGFNDSQTRRYDLGRKLDDTLTLQIPIILGAKPITVPIELTNIELP
jgi:hypothetical protein